MQRHKRETTGVELLLDARKLEHTGIGRVTRELVRGLAADASRLPGTLGILTLPAGARESWELDEGAVRVLPARPFSLLEGWRVRRILAELAPSTQLYHALHINVPALGKARPPRLVVTVHDAIPLVSPDYAGPKRYAFRRALIRAVRQATAVIVPSEASFSAVQRHVELSAGACHVIAPPLATVFREPVTAPFRERMDPAEAPLLAFASPRWHKNTAHLLETFAADPQRVARIDFVGTRAELAPRERQRFDALRREHGTQRLRLLGRLDDVALREAYRNALALLWPSRMEGYGLPVLEALACGCPVIAGPTSCALVEHCETVPLERPEAWAARVAGLRRDGAGRAELAQAALAAAATHSASQAIAAHRELYTSLWP